MAEKKKIGFVRNIGSGIIKLPPGFRFHPTDEELVVQYLRRKVLSFPLPASIIPEVDVSKYDPWDLPPGGGGGGRGGGDSEEERYYFSTNEAKYRKGNRTNRATASGYWKATGVDKRIVSPRSNHQLVGMKKTLVFYRGKPPSGSRTDWIMHEYRLTAGGTAPPCINGGVAPHTNNSSIIQSSVMQQMEDWVLCRIFLKKRNSKNDNVNAQTCNNNNNNRVQTLGVVVSRPNLIDFMMVEKTDMRSSSSSSSSSSSPASSIITDASSDHDDCNSVSSTSCREKP